MYQHIIDQFIQQESLPEAYRQDIQQWYLPLLPELIAWRERKSPSPLLLGINGAQGTGKSTLAKLLVLLLQECALRAVQISLDDFYLGRQQREQLGRQVHPLLATRGVPGTHDMQGLLRTIEELANAGADTCVRLPGFDKATDDTLDPQHWREVRGPVDMIIFEGWCIGVQPQAEADLLAPVNGLERQHDPDLLWRRHVNTRLGGIYQQVFEHIDVLLMLQAPGFAQVLQWRKLQEEKLRAKSAGNPVNISDSSSVGNPVGNPVSNNRGMEADQIDFFVQHFERLTRHCIQTLPQHADVVFTLNEAHQVTSRTGIRMLI